MAFLTLLAQNHNSCRKTDRRANIRQKVTIASLVQLIGLLALPQYLLQILTLTLPSLRSYPDPILETICIRPSGAWPTFLGTVLTTLPFISAVITTAKVEGGISIPPVLNESSAIRNIVSYFTLSSAAVAPILAFSETGENISMYISIYLLVWAVLPVAYFIIWPKLYPIFSSAELVDIAEQITPLRTSRTTNENNSHMRFEKALKLFDQGQIFEEMEMLNNSIKLYDEALAMWQSDNNETRQHFLGNFSADEIQSIRSARDADLIATILATKARLYERATVLKAAKCYLKAIEVFEFSPAMESTSRRSAIFPCFHSLFRLLREGKLERDFSFEKALAARFVEETNESNGYHHACALAMNAEMKFRSGLPEEALSEFARMKKAYHVKDTKAISQASGSDICGLAHSMSALWHMEMGDESNAVKQCELVIEMLDDFQSTDPKEMYAVLTPIIVILGKKQPGRIKKLYEDHVVKLVSGSMPLFVRNMRLVLSASDGSEVEDDLSFVLCRDNSELRVADHFFISLGLSVNTTAAEACLILAQRSTWDIHDSFCGGWSRSLVLDKGLAFAILASEGMTENDNVISSVANTKNQSVLTSLQALADEIGHDSGMGPSAKSRKSSFEAHKFRMRSVATLQLKAKETLPHNLLLNHITAAFVGLTHDTLASVFAKALSEEPRKIWESIYIFYVSDSLLENFKPWSEAKCVTFDCKDQSDDLRRRRQTSQKELYALLLGRAEELCFYEITHHSGFFGAWFDWREPGGYIHVSPSIWGVDVKKCPSQNFSWELDHQPGHDYNAYKRGIENLLSNANPFAIPLEMAINS
eukprot:CAMPEP_0172548182 /NCGR_PEP_ID=MMETSP1067-20121228/17545_1 /TAXON_ID=265564 ORGANISM="Thalassiosira punctigera, Strain Tpunct2005C2" /NCGR_SAMPLE_ID=MMETSP1067 /ASSEMBLY_ACC=CAM_ASM_000444 /LENGTH=817 /DNA_ID=CAMNT_0013335377 /DNA_START=326 /DNA_END=2779 /DNA_ORIENTATION=+